MQNKLSTTIISEQEMLSLSKQLPDTLDYGVVYLEGNLGVGKTTWVSGFIQSLGYKGRVKSPTYTLVEEYQLLQYKVFHFDLYRIAEPEELDLIGIRDYFTPNSLCFIEWPDKGLDYLPPSDLTIKIQMSGTKRNIEFIANSDRAQQWLKKIKA